MTSPLLSVMIPVYNAERYLRPALDSILGQTLSDLEVIAVDDGSKDRSREILESYALRDQRVRVISRPNTGICGALNDAIQAARSGFLARMDADDVSLPRRLEQQLRFLQDHSDCVAVGTAVEIIDSRGAVVDRHCPPERHAEIEAELLMGNGGALYHPTALFRADAVRAAGGYDPEFCRAEDVDLYLRLCRRGVLANLPEVGLQYRHHLQSTNFQHRKRQTELLTRILERERKLRNLAPVPLRSGHTDLSMGRLHARWACTALEHGRRSTAVRHALAGVLAAPIDRECWRALKYVATAQPPRSA